VSLIDAGGFPREPLRFGEPASVTFHVRDRVQHLGAVPVPAIEVSGNLAISGASLAFHADNLRYDGTSVHQTVGGSLCSAPTGLGTQLSTSVWTKGPADAALASAVHHWLGYAAIRVPDQPVGKGAIWKVSTTESAQQATVEQTATFQLDALDGAVARLHIRIQQTGGPQRVARVSPGLGDPPLDLLSLQASGEAFLSVSLAAAGLPTGSMRLSTTARWQPGEPAITIHDVQVFASTPTDRDGDLRSDDQDACPDDPEDCDGHEDGDGCPDADNDNDQILDACDRCPNDPETVNGRDDQDGCPDNKVTLVNLGPVPIDAHVVFPQASDAPSRSSGRVLDLAARILVEHPEIEKVALVGHAAPAERDGVRLGERRARSVERELRKRGVEAPRIEVRSLGATRPRAAASDAANQEKNRRVEFVIVRKAGAEIMRWTPQGYESAAPAAPAPAPAPAPPPQEPGCPLGPAPGRARTTCAGR
jgi:outer membrane protein OmpA-like peptidoglycan-associated protein